MIHFSWPLVAALAGVIVVVIIAGFLARRRPKKGLDQAYFLERWKAVQAQYKDGKTWPLAIIDGDKLVDEALKKCHYKGKTMGERLVSAQHQLSSNDTIWFGHKLRNKLVHEDYKINSKKDVQDALLGFLQALRDLGAIQ